MIRPGDQVRLVVACINWKSPPTVPHALFYVMHEGEMKIELYCATWQNAMERAALTAEVLTRHGCVLTRTPDPATQVAGGSEET